MNRSGKIPFFLKFNSSKENCEKIEAMLKRQDFVLERILATQQEIQDKFPEGAIVINRSELEVVEAANVNESDEVATLKADNRRLKEKLEEERNTIETLQNQPPSENQDLKEKNQDLLQENQDLLQENQDLKEKNQVLQGEKEQLDEQNKALRREKKNLQAQFDALKIESHETSKDLQSVVEPYLVLGKRLETCPSTCELITPYAPLSKVENRIKFVGFVGSERSLTQSVYNAMKRYKTEHPKAVNGEEKELINQINLFYKKREGINYDLLQLPEDTGKFDKNKYQDLVKPSNTTFRNYEEVYVPMVMKDEKVVQFRGIVKGK